MQVSVQTLKNRLSEYLRRAQAGEDVVITSRGRPVARLVGVRKQATDPRTTPLERLRSTGWIRPPERVEGEGVESLEPVTIPDEVSLSEAVMADRRDATR